MFVCRICAKPNTKQYYKLGQPRKYCVDCQKLVQAKKVFYDYKKRSYVDAATGKSIGLKASSTSWKHGSLQDEGNIASFNSPSYEVLYEDAPWRVLRGDRLLAEVGVDRTDVLIFFKLLTNNPDLFRFCQYQYGIWPTVLPPEYNMMEARSYEPSEVCVKLNITPSMHRQYIDAVAGGWRGFNRIKGGGRILGTNDVKEVSKVKQSLSEDKIKDMFLKYRFPESMFNLPGRPAEDNELEMEWFAERVLDWQKLLDEPQALQLTRQLLMKELDLERIRMTLMKKMPDDETYGPMQKILSSKEGEYQVMWQQIHDTYPIAGAIAKKTAVTGIISDTISGVREFYSNADNQIIDGLYTALEIQVMLRASEQMPIPQYRPSLVASVNEAMAHLWDKDWRSCFSQADLKKLDQGWKAAIAAIHDEALPNLLSESSSGEYKKLIQPSNVFGGNDEDEEEDETESVSGASQGPRHKEAVVAT